MARVLVVAALLVLTIVSLAGFAAASRGGDRRELSGVFDGAYCYQCERVMAELQTELANSTDVAHIVATIQTRLCDPLPVLERKICKTLVSDVFVQLESLDLTWIERYSPKASCSVISMCTVECCEVPYTPEQIHISATSDPSEMVVMWATDRATNVSMVQYGLQQSALTFAAVGNTTTYKASGWRGVLHIVTLTNLLPNTTYYYRVGDPSYGWSKNAYFQFTTRPSPSTDANRVYSYAIYGDMGSDDASDDTVYQLSRLIRSNQIDMVAHAGDIAYSDGYDALFDNYMRKIEQVAAYVPYMTSVGNHEFLWNFTAYKHRFSMPWRQSNSPSELYHSFDYGHVHWVAYSCEKDLGRAPDLQPGGEQYNWLESDLQAAAANRKNVPWIVLFGHRPLYCSNNSKRCTEQAVRYRGFIEPLLHKYGVDLVIQAHLHDYERTLPVYQGVPDSSYTNPNGTVYLVVGTAGNRESLNGGFQPQPWSVKQLSTFGFGVVLASKTNLQVSFLAADTTAVLDQFSITKTSK